ncbi:MAG: arsenite methyltransferase [Clostridia bacterium]|nr:arsenite methyltransferase [Clostridia bacterium]
MESEVRTKVKKFYGSIAKKVGASKSGCCGSSCGCGSISEASLIYDGENLQGLPEEALQASLGCANPLMFAKLREGETVLDLGSGGGINVLMAAKHVGSSGKVYGLDMTDEMLQLANQNKQKMGVTNVEFLKGYIEDIPLPDNSIEVIMSNCVINLSDDKEKALSEAFRVLKSGGRLAIADIITMKDIPQRVRSTAEMWSSCLGGTIKASEYKEILEKVGFQDIEIEPVHIYTRSVIEETFLKNRLFAGMIKKSYLDALDGAFAGAYIKAHK